MLRSAPGLLAPCNCPQALHQSRKYVKASFPRTQQPKFERAFYATHAQKMAVAPAMLASIQFLRYQPKVVRLLLLRSMQKNTMAIDYSSNQDRFGSRDLLLLLFTRPLPRDGGMAEDHGAPEAGQLPRVWTRGHKETKSRQRVSGAKSP